jgi:hypothetical protein
MTITLQDPALERDPTSRHAFPEVPGEPELRARPTLAEELLASYRSGELDPETAFERDGELIRVPLRDVTSYA